MEMQWRLRYHYLYYTIYFSRAVHGWSLEIFCVYGKKGEGVCFSPLLPSLILFRKAPCAGERAVNTERARGPEGGAVLAPDFRPLTHGFLAQQACCPCAGHWLQASV